MASPSRLSDSLQRFRLDGARDTGITVGNGSYATVLQYDFRGLKCVGKKIHHLLYEHASPDERTDMLRRFEEECELLGRLHHPNIVQFLGVHVETKSKLPVLVMEYLPTNLSSYLKRQGVLSTEIGYGILRDVALGLRYLHEYSPPIVHRDLSANNVLLTASLSAKISDLGVAKILNITPSQMTQQMSTKAPGTPCYMPPEALLARPSYTRKIDSYSFGVMVLHVLCGEWPLPTDAFHRDPHNPGIFVPVTEVDRRAEFLQKMGSDHPLSGLVRQCLSNAPDERPESADILQQINTALSQIPAPAETVFQQLEGLRRDNQRLVTEIQRVPITFGDEIESLKTENQSLRREILMLRETQPSSSGAAVNQPLVYEVESLSAPEWELDAKCALCWQEFNKLKGYWRHHCRNCGKSVCSSCSSKRLALPHYGLNHPTKVCDVCFNELNKGESEDEGKGTEDDADLSQEYLQVSLAQVSQKPLAQGEEATEEEDDFQLVEQDNKLHSEVKLQWRGCADAPMKISRAQVVVVGEKVYVGGGTTPNIGNEYQVFQYNWRGDTWSTLPRCPVRLFGMAHFMGRIITVGGTKQYSPTGEIYALREKPQQWEEFINPMPTARCSLSVVTTPGAIVAAGGDIGSKIYSSTVEVYSSDTSQWHAADPLPRPCIWTSSVTIDNVCYLLGGEDQNFWCTFLPFLIQKAMSSTPHSARSVWNRLPPTPLKVSTAASLSGSLMAIGGKGDDDSTLSAVYSFLNNSWVRLENVLSPLSEGAAAQLSPAEVIVIGGWDKKHQQSKSVFIGRLNSQ